MPLAGGATAAVKAVSPSGRVPYLRHRGAEIWESLAIAEYCAELAPPLWPAERARPGPRPGHRRRDARRLPGAAPGHADEPGPRYARPRADAGEPADIARIEAIWAATRAAYGAGGPFLFGAAFTPPTRCTRRSRPGC